MTTGFVAGSRKLGRLNEQVKERLGNVIAGSYQVLLGNTTGADKVVQTFLQELCYHNVIAYCSGEKCRINLGSWPTYNVPVPSNNIRYDPV